MERVPGYYSILRSSIRRQHFYFSVLLKKISNLFDSKTRLSDLKLVCGSGADTGFPPPTVVGGGLSTSGLPLSCTTLNKLFYIYFQSQIPFPQLVEVKKDYLEGRAR